MTESVNDENKYLFSIIIAVKNTETYLDECISSVINQTIGFEKNVQLILVDDASEDDSKNILLKYKNLYPNNIIVLSQENLGQSSARNLGLTQVSGKFVNFLDSDDFLSENALLEVANFFEKNEDVNIVSIPRVLFERISVYDELNYNGRNEIIDLTNEPNYPLISVSSTFINYSLITSNNVTFEPKLPHSEDTLFINELLLQENKYGVVNFARYYYRKRLTLNGLSDVVLFDDYYYNGRFDDFHEKLISKSIENRGHVPNFIQHVLLYDLKNLVSNSKLNSLDHHHYTLDKLHDVITKIDDDNIKQNELIDDKLGEFFLALKSNDYKNEYDELSDLAATFLNKYSQGSVKVSIIIPVFNVEKYLEECLDSVINQSLKDIEILCVNDGSKDGSLEILNRYADKDSRIRIISKENEGQGIARNVGVKEALGEYIGFVDADDYIKEDMFEKLYENASDNDLDISMCYVTTFDESNKTFNEDAWYYTLKCFDGFDKKIFNHNDTKEFTHEISVTPYNKIYKRNLLIDNNLQFPGHIIFEDEVFYYDVYLKAKRISIVPENLYIYRINRAGSTVSFTEDNDFRDILKVFKLVRNVLKKNNLVDMYKKQIYNKFMHYCLLRYSQTSKKYRLFFWREMKEDFIKIVRFNKFAENDAISIDDLEPRVKKRVLDVCSSRSFNEFKYKDSKKIFSIVMAVYNTESYLDESILSVINQSIGFAHNIQLILVDDGSTDNSKDILLKYQKSFPDNIIVLSQENQGQASARNLGLKYVTGQYVNFLDSDDYFSFNALKEVYEFFMKFGDKTDVVSLPLIQFGRVNGPHILNYKFSETRVIDLVKEPNNPQLHISSSFIKVGALEGIHFPTSFVGSEDSHALIKVLLKKKSLGTIPYSKYFYRKREDLSSTLDTMLVDFKHYTPRLKFHFMELIDYSIKKYGEVPKFLQYSLIYDLQWILNISDDSIFKNSLEREEFNSYIKNILEFIDNDVIINNKNINDGKLKNFIYSLKNDKIVDVENDNVLLSSNDKLWDQLKIHKIWLDIVEFRDDNLIISGLFNSLFDRDSISIIATKENDKKSEIFRGEYVEYTSRPDKKFLLGTWQFNSNFDIVIPLSRKEKSNVKLFVCYHINHDNCDYEEDNLIKFNLSSDFNKFCSLSKNFTYITNGELIVVFKNNSFHIYPYSFLRLYKLENNILKRLQNSKNENELEAFKLRRSYLYSYPFIKFLKKFISIYLFSDRIEMAGDNAEQLFNYAMTQHDSISKFFVIGEDTQDYVRLKSKRHIIKFNSKIHKFLYLFADKVISSHPDDEIFDPFFDNYKMYSNLVSSKKYFLQHGVTKDDISTWLRKFDKNISLVTAVAKIEQESFFNSKDGYPNEIVEVLGFPRFDKLNNNNVKKQILIMPTWVNERMDENKFKKTDYFNKLYEFLHSEKLCNLCKKFNYNIIFRPHPMLLKYLELFETPDFIEVELNKTYSELFNESSLLITDYSSVSFDFAYLKKPVIYYQYYDYYNFDLEKSYFKYELMGFGDVIRDEECLLEKIEYYLENNCNMEKKYIERVNTFFEYTDNNNSKRNYDWIKEH